MSVSAILLFEILATIAVIQILIIQANTQGPIYLQNVSEKVSPLVKHNAAWEVFDRFFHPIKKTSQDDTVVISEFFDFTLAFNDLASNNPDELKQQTILIEIPNSQNTASEERKTKLSIDTQSSDTGATSDVAKNALFIIVNKEFRALYNVKSKIQLEQSLESISKKQKDMLVQAMSEAKTIKKRNFNSVIVAQPILENGQVVGAILAGFSIPFQNILVDVIPNLLKVLLVFTIVIAIVGSIFGYFSSRTLVRRFNKIQAGPEAWQKGDFNFRIDGSAKDELGKLARQLNNMAEEIQRLMQNRQELATLEERQRLARELHDSVKQQIFASGMQLATVKLKTEENSATTKHLDAAEALIHKAQEELTTLIHKLMPVALEGKGLVQAIREHIEVWQDNEGILVDFQTKNDIKIASELEYALFRIIQEACSNIARHSQATKVVIRLEQTQNKLLLSIKDNGIGFNKSKSTRGIGLLSMSERLEPFEGKLAIETKPNQGTKLVIEIPNKGAKDV